jgi:UDP-N-acetylglucosamine transferase subunit ALG13
VIFVTVGTALGFERFVGCVDRWAAEHPDIECFAQIGETDSFPRHMDYATTIDSDDFERYCRRASVIASHAGMGTIISALTAGTPIVIFPRRADLSEHRSDHQIATVAHFAHRTGIHAAHTCEELWDLLNRREQLAAPEPIGSDASPELLKGLRGFLGQG